MNLFDFLIVLVSVSALLTAVIYVMLKATDIQCKKQHEQERLALESKYRSLPDEKLIHIIGDLKSSMDHIQDYIKDNPPNGTVNLTPFSSLEHFTTSMNCAIKELTRRGHDPILFHPDLRLDLLLVWVKNNLP